MDTDTSVKRKITIRKITLAVNLTRENSVQSQYMATVILCICILLFGILRILKRLPIDCNGIENGLNWELQALNSYSKDSTMNFILMEHSYAKYHFLFNIAHGFVNITFRPPYNLIFGDNIDEFYIVDNNSKIKCYSNGMNKNKLLSMIIWMCGWLQEYRINASLYEIASNNITLHLFTQTQITTKNRIRSLENDKHIIEKLLWSSIYS